MVLAALFRGKRGGFYVDVGAHHPKRYSNTYLFFKNKWSGINIDPNPETIKLFNKSRKKDVNIQSGIMNSTGKRTYYRFSDPAVNTFSKEEAEKWIDKKWIVFLGSEEVDVVPLRDIFHKNLSKDQKVDLLSIDAEGFDLEVLESNDWDKWKPDVIVIENSQFKMHRQESDKMFIFLTEKGYRLSGLTGPSLIFSKNENAKI